MIQYNMFGINLMQIWIFLKCAEYGSFSKAAKSLQITSSMVSKHMASLENSTGLILFIRDKNHVILTPAGRELQNKWERIVDIFTLSLECAHRVQAVLDNSIIFGLGDSINIENYFFPLLNSCNKNGLQISFKVELRQNFDLLDDLAAEILDIAFAPKFMESKIAAMEGLDYFMALPSPLYAGFSKANPLLSNDTLKMDDLKNVGIIMPDLNYYEKWITALCAECGYKPKIDRRIDAGGSEFLNVNNENIFIADKYYRAFQSDSIVFRELEGTESGILMIWKKKCKPGVSKFIRFAKEFTGKFNQNKKMK